MGTTLTTTDVIGRAEDVSDIITNLTPSKTPFLTAIGSDTTHNTEFKWQEDKLRNSRANAAVEGADATAVARTPTLMRRNGCQILQDTFTISETEDTVKQYGIDKMTAYQTVKVGKELKLDLERAYVSDQPYVERVADQVAGQTAGAGAMIADSNTVDAAYTPAAGQTPASGGVITDDLVFQASSKTARAGGTDCDVLMVRFADMASVVKLGAIAPLQRIVGTDASAKVVNTINFYVTPFHELKVVRNLEMDAFTNAYLLDPSMWKDTVLRGWNRRQLAKTGDATKTQMITERGLKHKNFASSGRIKNLKPVA